MRNSYQTKSDQDLSSSNDRRRAAAGIGGRAAALGCAAILALAVLAVSCGDEPSPQEPVDAAMPDALSEDFAVRGRAIGVLGPVALELRLGGDSELLSVREDMEFAFETRLATGASYTVALVDPSLPCTLRNQAGVIAGADPTIELTCTGASLASVVVSGMAPVITLVPGTNEYVVELPLSQQSATLTATVATAGDTLTIAGTPVASGTPSAELTLSLGDNPVDIVVDSPLGWQRTYRLILRRAPQVVQRAYGKASNTGAGDDFGCSVALSGDTLAVGAFGESSAAQGAGGDQDDDSIFSSGAVYVFRRTGTAWQQEAYLKASNPGASDQFGYRVALSGDTLAIGANLENSASQGVGGDQDDNAAVDSGAVYVFRRTGTAWQQEVYLKASNTGAGDQFGASVALAGDTLAVGAPGEDSAAQGVDGDQDDDTAVDRGAVYVFRRTGTAWQQEAYVKGASTGARAGDAFGFDVALSGDALAVGATREINEPPDVAGEPDDDPPADSGAVYVFRRTGTAWQQEEHLAASETAGADFFGWSVALSDDTLAIGAIGYAGEWLGVDGNLSGNAVSDAGVVYVFRRTGAGWQQEACLGASNAGFLDAFGWSVALSGDLLAVGARGESSGAQGVGGNQDDYSAWESGAVYVFHRAGTAWQQAEYLKASNTGAGDLFGYGVALSGDVLAIGARHEDSAAQGVDGDQDDNAAVDSGAVYIFQID